MALALSSVRSSFPLEIAASLTSFEPQLTRHLPQVPSGDSTQRKPAHPPSWVSSRLCSLSGALLLEAAVLPYLFMCLVLISFPLQVEALSLWIGAGAKTQKSTWYRVTDGGDGMLAEHPRAAA